MVVIAIFRVIKAPFIDGNLSIIDCYAEAVHVFRNFVHVIKNRLVGAPVHVIEKTVHVHENCCSRVLRILIYVLFEVGRVYDPKRQFNVPQRVTIGKLVSEADNTQMQPNEKFLELFPECRPLPQEQASVRSNTISAGTFIALDSIVREYKLRQLLDDAFGRDAGFILDLAAYMIVSEDNAAQYYPDYARRHPLFTEGMSVKSDSSVSRLLSRMGRDQITAFLDAWNARQDHRHRIYISYDSTNKNSQAGLNFQPSLLSRSRRPEFWVDFLVVSIQGRS